MANNRLILQCKCKKDYGVILAKHYDCGWFTQDYNVRNGNPPVDLREDLNEYYEKHIECFFELGDNCFHVCTEDEHEVLKEVEVHNIKEETTMSGNEFVKHHNKMFNELIAKAIAQSYLNKFKEDSNMKNETYRLALKEELQEIAEEMAVELIGALNEHELEANEYYDREAYYKEPIREREMLHQVVNILNIIAYGRTN